MKNTKNIVILALLTAIEVIFAFTILGSIPVGPGIVATLAHIPPIIAATLLGKKQGLFMGCAFGILSLIYWSTMGVASPVAFAFTPLAANGLTAYIFDWIMKATNGKTAVSASVSAGIGTIVHSFLVFLFLYLFFRDHETVGHNFLNVVIAWGGLNAVMEIIIAVIINGALVPALKKVKI